MCVALIRGYLKSKGYCGMYNKNFELEELKHFQYILLDSLKASLILKSFKKLYCRSVSIIKLVMQIFSYRFERIKIITKMFGTTNNNYTF